MNAESRRLRVGVGVFVACLANYVYTLAPTVYWGDSGEFITAAHTLGICHPTGYPLYVLLAKVFTLLPVADIAWRVNLLSAVAGSGACTLLYFSVLEWARLLSPEADAPLPALVAAASAALALAFTRVLWSQSVIAEVYSLHLFVNTLSVFLLMRWIRTGKSAWLFGGIFAWGLAFTNHVTSLLLAPLILALLAGRFYQSREAWKPVLFSSLFFLLGFSLYFYLPLRSSMDPIIDWNNPENWENFWYHLRGGQFAELDTTLDRGRYASTTIIHFGDVLQRLFRDFGFLLLLLIPAFFHPLRGRRWVIQAGLLATIAVNGFWVSGYRRPDNDNYLLLVYLCAALLIGAGILWVLRALREPLKENRPLYAVIAVALLLFPFSNYTGAFHVASQRGNTSAFEYIEDVFAAVEPDAALLFEGEEVHLYWYGKHVAGMGDGIAPVGLNFLSTSPWYQTYLDRLDVPLEAKLIRFDRMPDPMAEFTAWRVRILDRLTAVRPVYSTTVFNAPGYRFEHVASPEPPRELMPAYFENAWPTGHVWRVVPEGQP